MFSIAANYTRRARGGVHETSARLIRTGLRYNAREGRPSSREALAGSLPLTKGPTIRMPSPDPPAQVRSVAMPPIVAKTGASKPSTAKERPLSK